MKDNTKIRIEALFNKSQIEGVSIILAVNHNLLYIPLISENTINKNIVLNTTNPLTMIITQP